MLSPYRKDKYDEKKKTHKIYKSKINNQIYYDEPMLIDFDSEMKVDN